LELFELSKLIVGYWESAILFIFFNADPMKVSEIFAFPHLIAAISADRFRGPHFVV
jgi:hypothetical protein